MNVCQFGCEHTCTLVGHAVESLRFLNQCLEHGIVASAVEGDPEFLKLAVQMRTLNRLIDQRANARTEKREL